MTIMTTYLGVVNLTQVGVINNMADFNSNESGKDRLTFYFAKILLILTIQYISTGNYRLFVRISVLYTSFRGTKLIDIDEYWSESTP